MYQFQQRLKNVKLRIKIWNKEVFSNIFEEKRRLETEMETIQIEAIAGEQIDKERNKEDQIRIELNKRDK
jgi:hypothetical protein